jgi:hypothetical protein
MKFLFHKEGSNGHHQCDSNCNHDHHHHHHHEEEIAIDDIDLTFDNFLKFFPAIELPFTISTDTQRQVQEIQKPINSSWITKFILDKDSLDEFTEFMPCFSIPDSKNFNTLIYWQASLEGNAFFLCTFDKNNALIDHRLVAGTLYLEDGMKQLVCSIGKDLSINRVEGQLGPKGEIIKSENPQITFMQLTTEGEIVED